MTPDEKPVSSTIRGSALEIGDLADLALSDLTQPLAPPSLPAAADVPRPSDAEIRPILEALSHDDPLDTFLHREKSLAADQAAEAVASAVKSPPSKTAGGTHFAQHNNKSQQATQKWVARRFA
jgi:hypothetical protein